MNDSIRDCFCICFPCQLGHRKDIAEPGGLGFDVLKQKSFFFQTPVLHVDAQQGQNCEFIASKSCKYQRKWMIGLQIESRTFVKVIGLMVKVVDWINNVKNLQKQWDRNEGVI